MNGLEERSSVRSLLRDRWLDFWHRLPPFRGRLAIARIVAQHLLTGRTNSVAWATLPNGFRLKVDIRWKGGYDVLYYFRTYEPALTALIRASLEEDDAEFIDVGANVGAFCVLAADILRRRNGRALAAEPLAQNLAFLRSSVSLNHLEDVIEVTGVAVGDREGSLELEVMAPGEIANARPTTWSSASSDGVTTIRVPMTTLNHLTQGWSKVRFVKIDVEGAELFVLRGATQLLRRDRPLVYCEFHREFMEANGTTLEDIEAFARAVAYSLRYLGTEGRIVSRHPDPQSRFLDLILVPDDPSPHQRSLMDTVP